MLEFELFSKLWRNNLYKNYRMKRSKKNKCRLVLFIQKHIVQPLFIEIIKYKRILEKRKLIILNSPRMLYKHEKKRSIIYAPTHISKCDIEVVFEAVKQHCYLLSGTPEYLIESFDGVMLFLNGVIYLDMKDRNDRKVAIKSLEKVLEAGGNVMWFPEGTWNFSENKLILPLFPGISKVAMRTKSLILPIALERDKNSFYVQFADYIDAQNYSDESLLLKEIEQRLLDTKWNIIEKIPTTYRSSINEDYYNNDIKNRINEWLPKNNYKIVYEKLLSDIYSKENKLNK